MKAEQILKFAWNEFVYGGHLLSFGAVSVVFTSAILLDINITIDFLLLVYLIAYTVYLYNRLKEYREDFLTNPERTHHIKGYIKYTPFIIFCCVFAIAGMLVYFGNQTSLIFGLLLLLFGLLYSIYFKRMTKKIVGFKNFYVSLMWSLLVVFLALYYSFTLNLSLIFIGTFVFLRFVIHECFFDTKDIISDKKENLLTMVIIFGKEKLLNILNFINVVTAVLLVIGVYLCFIPIYSLALLLTIPYSIYYLRKIKDEKTSKSFLYSVIVNGEFISWSFFILLGRALL